MARRKFSQEFKREAVAMTLLPGATLKQIGEDLGIGPNLLGRWRGNLKQQGDQAFPGQR